MNQTLYSLGQRWENRSKGGIENSEGKPLISPPETKAWVDKLEFAGNSRSWKCHFQLLEWNHKGCGVRGNWCRVEVNGKRLPLHSCQPGSLLQSSW